MNTKALFLGGLCVDLTVKTDHWPGPNEKHTAEKEVRCPGGGATNAARCYKQLGLQCELLAPLGLDGLGADLRNWLGHAGIQLHPRDVTETPIAIVRPESGDRSLLRGPELAYSDPDKFPELDPGNYRRLHLDGKEAEAALHHAKVFRERKLDVSLDANPRPNTEDLLNFANIVFASEKYFIGKKCSYDEFFDFLRSKGCTVGGVTMGGKGVVWFAPDTRGETKAFFVPPEHVVDTSGAGDGFQGAFLASCDLWGAGRSWGQHIRFASAVGALMVQRFGNKLFPTQDEVDALLRPHAVALCG